MEEGPRLVWIGIALTLVMLGLVWLWPKIEREFEPELVAAHVAIQVAGRSAAEFGAVELDSGQEFELHAVLEARRRDGSTLYYTDAEALRIEGRAVTSDALQRWDRGELRALWFTVEPAAPFRSVSSVEDIDPPRFVEVFQADWPHSWSVPGSLGQIDRRLEPDARRSVLAEPFGTARFHVRLELMAPGNQVMPLARYSSPGKEDVQVASFPRVTLGLDGVLGPASRVYRLPQLEPEPGNSELLRVLLDRTRRRLAFSRLTVLQQVLESVGLGPSDVVWSELDLAEGARWQDDDTVSRGDLLRAGARTVLLYADRMPFGRLDRGDLVFDFDRGFSIIPVGEVFAESGGLIEIGDLPTLVDQ